MSNGAKTCCGGTEGTTCGTENRRFDLAVIGAGSAGFSAAITAADQGAQVVLIGGGTIGGTCVNVGCVPSKTLIRAMDGLHQATAATRFAGIHSQARLADWHALIAQKDALVTGLRQAKYIDLLPSYETVTYMEGTACLTPGGVSVDGRPLTAGKIIITTGAAAAIPPITGLDQVPYLTSTEALALAALPRSLLVIGAGFIGCELAQMLARAGVAVTILCRRCLLPEGEPEISAALTEVFRDEGITVRDGIAYDDIRRSETGVTLRLRTTEGSERVDAEKVLVATGRRPNTEGLGLEAAGVALTENGGIGVDEFMRTSNENIFAAGDVTGRDMFVYMAAYGARIAAENALGAAQRYDASAMPAVTFTDPQAASVGLTEAAARQSGLTVRSSILPLSQLPRALAAHDTRGLIKLVAETESGRLVGAHILAPEGGDSIQTAALAIKQGLTHRELGATLFPYLTTVEGLKLAAQGFEKDLAMLSCCAG